MDRQFTSPPMEKYLLNSTITLVSTVKAFRVGTLAEIKDTKTRVDLSIMYASQKSQTFSRI